MSINIDLEALQQAVSVVASEFATKDISEQAALQVAHGSTASHRNWHAIVGRQLSEHRALLGIESVGDGARGRRWSKQGNTAAPHLAAPSVNRPVAAACDAAELGPQYAGDGRFAARMRLHQSWWRAHELKVPCGVGPTRSSTSRSGNMLDETAAAAGLNFLTPEIFAVVRRRLAEGQGALEPFRLLHNLLSSQPMCFNLMGPLVGQPERATRLVRALVGDEVARVHSVAIEWAPEPAANHLNDRTAFDAFVDYERPDGSRAALGIETKLTDSFSQRPYDGANYRRWMPAVDGPFRPDAHGELPMPRHNQLWRNHLLALSLRQRSFPYAAVHSAVVLHPHDDDGASVVASYRELLQPGDVTFQAWTLEQVIAAFERTAVEDEHAWLHAFRRRYIALEASARASKGHP